MAAIKLVIGDSQISLTEFGELRSIQLKEIVTVKIPKLFIGNVMSTSHTDDVISFGFYAFSKM